MHYNHLLRYGFDSKCWSALEVCYENALYKFTFDIDIDIEGTLQQICLQNKANMNVGVAHSDPNPNSTFFNSRGMWVTYIIIVGIVHYMLLSLPFLSVAGAWTITNVLHNVVYTSYIAMNMGG